MTTASRTRARPPKPQDSRQMALLCAAAAGNKKAYDLLLLDISRLSSMADYFLLASARSSRQATSVAEHVQSVLKKSGAKLLGADGIKDGRWALLDFGEVVVHIFLEPVRKLYDLESLWADAPAETPDPEILAAILPPDPSANAAARLLSHGDALL